MPQQRATDSQFQQVLVNCALEEMKAFNPLGVRLLRFLAAGFQLSAIYRILNEENDSLGRPAVDFAELFLEIKRAQKELAELMHQPPAIEEYSSSPEDSNQQIVSLPIS
ncbi:Hypothetical protein PBC10988_11570 [Planctomycetales bacterium 10988]|nr:Hypothetical protein PBC10988_11570 [Planctomycetales bacterium 10988]